MAESDRLWPGRISIPFPYVLRRIRPRCLLVTNYEHRSFQIDRGIGTLALLSCHVLNRFLILEADLVG
jgi:hypothetical protein